MSTTVATAEVATYLNRLVQAAEALDRAAYRVERDAVNARTALKRGYRPSENGQSAADLLAAISKINVLLEMAPAGTEPEMLALAVDTDTAVGSPYFTV